MSRVKGCVLKAYLTECVTSIYLLILLAKPDVLVGIFARIPQFEAFP